MTKRSTLILGLAFCCVQAQAQKLFDENIKIPAGYAPTEIVMPPSPLTTQVLFVGGTDMVQTTATYGNAAGEQPAKEWHDFIGFTPDNSGQSMGWVSVNHEMILADDKLGDGGGMTVFRVKRAADGNLEIVDQTLEDGRQGKFFNVDFANTVGETGMNCGGISSIVDGRIWTAEEWWLGSNRAAFSSGRGVRDTSDFTVKSDIPGWNGKVLKKHQNFNWMVEIDPRQAKAIRKQYNWGRQPFEGGVIAPDNRIVYLGPDATPGFFGMFVAETPGDFNRGTLFAYKHDKPGSWKWEPIWEDGSLLEHTNTALAKGATFFNRIEWVTIDPKDNFVYFTETGRDRPADVFAQSVNAGGKIHPAIQARAQAKGLASATDPNYRDYYGRVWKYNPMTSELSIFIEGGPDFEDSPVEGDYPETHLSNPDGLAVIEIDGKSFLLIQEDLNGRSAGRMPAGATASVCEAFLLDLSIEKPTLKDLIRLMATPVGAEITGAIQTPDKKSILINSQHPSTNNPFPYNHSLTIAIHGIDKIKVNELTDKNPFKEIKLTGDAGSSDEVFSVYPNPTTRTVYTNTVTDLALYNATGERILVKRGTNEMEVSHLTPGVYYIQNAKGETLKLLIQ